jgi:hypothetical protein
VGGNSFSITLLLMQWSDYISVQILTYFWRLSYSCLASVYGYRIEESFAILSSIMIFFGFTMLLSDLQMRSAEKTEGWWLFESDHRCSDVDCNCLCFHRNREYRALFI